MKAIKTLGLAAFAALMAIVLLGASSAMASDHTALCKEDPEEEPFCPAEKLFKHIHEATLKGPKATLLNSISNLLCDVLVLGDVISKNLLSELSGEKNLPLVIKGNFTYINCLDEKPNECVITEESAFTTIKVLKEGHETASVTGEGEIKVVCSGISCVYNWKELKGTGKGPLLSVEANGSVTITEQTTNKVKGLLCPSTSKLDLQLVPLEPTYIVE